MKQTRIGIIGCGDISTNYCKHAPQFPVLDFAACADLDVAKAQKLASEFGIVKHCSVAELLADDAIDIVLNLTIPAAHATVSLQAIDAGKHVYCEKPLAVTPSDGRRILDAAKAKGVRVGCAPDTVLGTSHQTCRQLIDEGAIGKPVAAVALMLCPGHESWHPSPMFYYQPGGGPMFDMGPYYLSSLIQLLGPAERIASIAGIQIPDRTITSQPLSGTKIDVETPDHVAGTVQFASGAIATLVTSFATRFRTDNPRQPITIYGTEGTLQVPDPNGFAGVIKLRQLEDKDWQEIAPRHTHPNGRSLGLADMAHAIQQGRAHRASGELGFAVLEAMQAFLDSSTSGEHRQLSTAYGRPPMVPPGLEGGLISG